MMKRSGIVVVSMACWLSVLLVPSINVFCFSPPLLLQQQHLPMIRRQTHGFDSSFAQKTSSTWHNALDCNNGAFKQQVHASSNSLSPSSSSSSRSNENDGESAFKNLEEVRASLEAIVAATSFPSGSQQQQQQQGRSRDGPGEPMVTPTHHPILTSTGRRFREIEMDLLSQLHDSDDAVEALMDLWMRESHDVVDMDDLKRMQAQCSSGLVWEEQRLRDMMEKHPYWAEPMARLATLLYYKGRTVESYHMALAALQRKPWHFEVAQLLILLCLREQDWKGALYWARNASLPSIVGIVPTTRRAYDDVDDGNDTSMFSHMSSSLRKPLNSRRVRWVQNALEQAAELWEQAEAETMDFLNEHDQEHEFWSVQETIANNVVESGGVVGGSWQ